jgi:hypothetical protein
MADRHRLTQLKEGLGIRQEMPDTGHEKTGLTLVSVALRV